MSLRQDIEDLNRKFGKKIAHQLLANLEIALKKGGSKNVQEAKLSFVEVITPTAEGVTVQIVASGEYWYYLDKGRGKGKPPPSKALGKDWQVSQGIDARKVIAQIELRSEVERKGLKLGSKVRLKDRIKTRTKELNIDKAAKQLSYILASSIGAKGYKPRPFVQQTIDEMDMEGYSASIADLMGDHIKITLNVK